MKAVKALYTLVTSNTVKVASTGAVPEMTADKQGSITVSANAVVLVGTTTVVPNVIESTLMWYTPAVEGSRNGPALKTPCAEIV